MVEWQGTRQHGIDDATKAPNIARECVWLLLKNFRSDIAKCSEGLICRLMWTNDLGEAEVNDLRNGFVGTITHHDVLKLKVSVHNSETM